MLGAALLLPLAIFACDGEVGDATVGETDPNTSSTSQATNNPQTTDEPDSTTTTGDVTSTSTGGCEDPNVECMCNDDADCPPSQTCSNNGVCVGESGETDDPMTTTTTGDPTGNDVCGGDEDCPPGTECIDGLCLGDPMTTGDPTTGDPTGDSDTNGCEDPNILCCQADSDCPPGQLCNDGFCEGGQTTGDPGVCGDGIVDADEECDDGNDNPNDGCSNCMLTECNNPNCCQVDEDCPPGEVCSEEGMCTGGFLQCEDDSDCPPMSLCLNGLCA